jgi:hypothetical protein
MNYLKAIKCLLFGHKYRIVQQFSKTVRRIKCDCCGGDWGMNDRVRVIVKWDSELEEMHGESCEIKEPSFNYD